MYVVITYCTAITHVLMYNLINQNNYTVQYSTLPLQYSTFTVQYSTLYYYCIEC